MQRNSVTISNVFRSSPRGHLSLSKRAVRLLSLTRLYWKLRSAVMMIEVSDSATEFPIQPRTKFVHKGSHTRKLLFVFCIANPPPLQQGLVASRLTPSVFSRWCRVWVRTRTSPTASLPQEQEDSSPVGASSSHNTDSQF